MVIGYAHVSTEDQDPVAQGRRTGKCFVGETCADTLYLGRVRGKHDDKKGKSQVEREEPTPTPVSWFRRDWLLQGDTIRYADVSLDYFSLAFIAPMA